MALNTLGCQHCGHPMVSICFEIPTHLPIWLQVPFQATFPLLPSLPQRHSDPHSSRTYAMLFPSHAVGHALPCSWSLHSTSASKLPFTLMASAHTPARLVRPRQGFITLSPQASTTPHRRICLAVSVLMAENILVSYLQHPPTCSETENMLKMCSAQK